MELLYTTSVWAESRAEYLDECTSLTRYVGLPQSRMHPLHGQHAPLLSHANITGTAAALAAALAANLAAALAAAAASLAAADLSLL